MINSTFKPCTLIYSQISCYSKALFLFIFLSATLVAAQTHTFTSFNVGTVTSGTTGTSVALPTAGVTGNYLIYEISADFAGTGSGTTAWSEEIQMELNDGGTVIFSEVSKSTSGFMSNDSPTTLYWTGILNKAYVGGDNLTIRFFSSFNDALGPYTSNITNVNVNITEANPYAIASFDVGTVTSGTAGTSVPVTTTGITGNYLIYQISADFAGTGTGTTAWSEEIQMELNDGGTVIFSEVAKSTSGSMGNDSPTTLFWTGILNKEYVGGDNLTIRFFSSFNDALGPYTSNISNVNINIAEANPYAFASFDVGTVTSGTTGTSVAVATTGVTGDYLLYQISADFAGTGSGTTAWSEEIQMELNDGGTVIFKEVAKSTSGSMGSDSPTTLYWTGFLNKEYSGGDNLTIRFFSSYNVDGPYTSNISNVNVVLANLDNSTLTVNALDNNSKFSVYPVPFENELFIDYSFDYQTDVAIQVYDLKGALVESVVNKNYTSQSQAKSKLDLTAYRNQMFFVKLITNKGVSVKKIMSK
ncbi:T9SS type A sorting domain-containing protein [Algibacter amylolyticus]|uniref:T9SS type A sorting domain-containing protein n=1 Tax=Algibacter amylolyticus TaxID=1608400 RepID=A0A5M7BFC9_9FLAO|nr:T9SS type A sorting domain-containing protein [Algibacter amylolyticus]KAA5827683.1 T9SS type A sorting domain-containing protein [Algibacter amylolyticus]MBB5266899.1 hypothetical protein [Algibacter amylolyticus]TSJ81928.1 T9SS type A sorting domain-containing protein [Algibacter amylolyticus]